MITTTTKRFLRVLALVGVVFWRNKRIRKVAFIPGVILLIGFLVPQHMVIPVKGATTADWNEKSFWAYPWGSSITHKGIDIFKKKGTPITSSTQGIVVYTHEGGKGGKSVMILGPKWLFHYYAHLKEVKAFTFKPVKPGTIIGTVGTSGNAVGKPPHLHYAITTPFPYVHLYDGEGVHG